MQTSRPSGTNLWPKFNILTVLGAVFPHFWRDKGEIWLPHAKFHVYRGNVAPLRGEKSIFGPLSKNNTGMAALRAGLPVITLPNFAWKYFWKRSYWSSNLDSNKMTLIKASAGCKGVWRVASQASCASADIACVVYWILCKWEGTATPAKVAGSEVENSSRCRVQDSRSKC